VELEQTGGWPPAWGTDASPVDAIAAGRVQLPELGQLDYFIKASTALLLLLALPWLLLKLTTDPAAVLRGATRHHLT
jgi:hypothetical protein